MAARRERARAARPGPAHAVAARAGRRSVLAAAAAREAHGATRARVAADRLPLLLSPSCGPMMLDVLFKIKDDQDHTLAFRRSCR
jgi:hypothetical protein